MMFSLHCNTVHHVVKRSDTGSHLWFEAYWSLIPNGEDTAMLQALIPVITAFLGFAFSFAISFFTNKWNDKRAALNLLHENEKETRKIILEKGEHLYSDLARWKHEVEKYQLHLICIANKTLTRAQVTELVLSAKNDFRADRMHCLMNFYFPEILVDFDKADRLRAAAVKVGRNHENNVISDKECFTKVNELSDSFGEQMDFILSKLSKKISSIIS